MNVCPTMEAINNYITGNCTKDERLKVETHIAECKTCREKVESKRTERTEKTQSAVITKDIEETSRKAQLKLSESVTKSMQGTAGILSDTNSTQIGKSTFENYEILEELPRGGQAIVYKAVHIPTKTNVAIKVLLPSMLASERARYHFEREAELIAHLDHPNIVKIRDSGIIHGQYFFVMEYIEGQPLDRYVNLHKLSFRERIILFRKLCTAISYAHQQGIIHRDLKFGNIIMDKYGQPHILDFGLAKAIDLSEQAGKEVMVTVSGQWAGSLSNMSPEQASGKPNLIDVRSDVYSLGIILYHMLTGTYPYDISGSTLEVLQNIQKADVIRPRQIIRKFDTDLEAILLTALAKERTERYQSVAELQRDIDNWLEGRPISVRSVSTIYLMRKIIARHRYTSTVAGLLLVIILSFAYVSLNLYFTAKKAQRESESLAEQWNAEATGNLIFANQVTFTLFLQAWREGRSKEAEGIAGFFAKDSREIKASEFLLGNKSLAEKELDFRQSFSDRSPWFVDFILGEYYLKEGDTKKALEAYQRSYQAIRGFNSEQQKAERWLMVQIKTQLNELTKEENQSNTIPVNEVN